jgi:hypothetical protein
MVDEALDHRDHAPQLLLGGDPVRPGSSGLAPDIDDVGAGSHLLEGVGDRLGENEPLLREALGQLQMIFVQVKEANAGVAPDA